MSAQRSGSAASRVFLVVGLAGLLLGAILAGALVVEAQRAAREEAESVTTAVAETIAGFPAVGAALARDPGAAHAELQPFVERVLEGVDVDFVTIMTQDGTRVTHPDPAQIGLPYLGTIPATPERLTEEFAGTLGPSTRTIVPVVFDGALVGWTAAGVTVGSIASDVLLRLPFVVGISLAVLGAGLVGAALARRTTRRVAGDLPAGRIRDALSSYESVRTLGEALSAQTHEHGNRMHTAVALLELGRTDDAIAILTETSRASQDLVDTLGAYRDGDPTLGALLLGKTAQARERGVALTVEIDPDAPRGVMDPVDTVSVVGNLVDNAIDAAAEGTNPRWALINVRAGSNGGLIVTVSDSGRGIPEDLREKVFEHGFSTKPAGPEGRGVGLALVKGIVSGASGALRFDPGPPTTFRLAFPGPEPADPPTVVETRTPAEGRP